MPKEVYRKVIPFKPAKGAVIAEPETEDVTINNIEEELTIN